MKRRLFTILPALSMLLLVVQSCRRSTPAPRVNGATGPRHASDRPTKDGPPTTAPTTRPGRGMATAEGVALSVVLSPTNRMGEPIPAEVVLRNDSGVTIGYRDILPEDYVFHVHAADIKGRRVVPFSPPLSAGPGTLLPGEMLRREIDLARRLRLPGSGDYLLTVSALFRVHERPIVLHVNHAPFRVEGD